MNKFNYYFKSLLTVSLFIAGQLFAGENSLYFIESGLQDRAILQNAVDQSVRGNTEAFHLFAHGRPGELMVEGKWLGKEAVLSLLKSKVNKQIVQINIYACSFGADNKGREAMEYLRNELHIDIAASNDITGLGGDWNLEEGSASHTLSIPAYRHSLQPKVVCLPDDEYNEFNNTDDLIQGGYHSQMMRTNRGVIVSGANSSPSGGDQTLLTLISPVNGYNFTGTVKFATLASDGGSTQFAMISSNDSFYAWGSTGLMITTAVKSSAAFGRCAVQLPAGIIVDSIKEFVGSKGILAILSKGGRVFTMGSERTNLGGASSVWNLVSTGAKFADIDVGSNVLMAKTKTGDTLYTWGTATFLGNNTTAANRTTPTIMTSPLPAGVRAVQIAIGTPNKTNTCYLVLGSNKLVYALGDNSFGNCGDGTTTDRTSWVNVRNSTNTGNLTNVVFICMTDNSDHFTGSSAILRDGTVYMWGDNARDMLAGGGAGTLLLPRIPDGYSDIKKTFIVENGGHISPIIRTDGGYCHVGHNSAGGFGDGTTIDRSVYECYDLPEGDTIWGVGYVDAVADTLSTSKGFPITYDVLNNDNYLKDPSSVFILGTVANGTATVNPNGTITFTPNPGYLGTVSFSYVIHNICRTSDIDSAIVTVSVVECVEFSANRFSVGKVFNDTALDGINNSDPGLSNIGLNVYNDLNGNGIVDTGIDILMASPMSDATGNYSFLSSGVAKNYADSFGGPVFTGTTNNYGPNNWQSDVWTRDGSATTTNAIVEASAGGENSNIIGNRVIRLDGANVGVYRTVDLFKAVSAALTFSYDRRHSVMATDESLLAQISVNNGATYDTLINIKTSALPGAVKQIRVKIPSKYLGGVTRGVGANARIRFRTNAANDNGDYWWIDDVRLTSNEVIFNAVVSLNPATYGPTYTPTTVTTVPVAYSDTGCKSTFDFGLANFCLNGKNRDGDAVTNFCDLDDDNDGILDVVEGLDSCELPAKWVASNILESSTDTSVIGKQLSRNSTFQKITGLSDTLKPISFILNGMNPKINGFGVTFDPAGSITLNNATASAANDSIAYTITLPYPTNMCLTWGGGVFDLEETHLFKYNTGATYSFTGTPITSLTIADTPAKSMFVMRASADIAAATMAPLKMCFNNLTTLTIIRKDVAAGAGTSSWQYLSKQPCYADFDTDGIPNHLDFDSDNDGCADAVEGDENAYLGNLNANTSISGTVNANGVPNLVNPGGGADVGGDIGQGVGESINATLKGQCDNPTPDTIYTKPTCPTCPVNVCAVNDDIPAAIASSTSVCGTPANYSATAPTGPGCMTLTPNGLVKDTGKVCIVSCVVGRCDTTYVFLVPPTPTPDTIYVKPPCPTCPTTVCAVNDDVNTAGATSTSFCGTPTNYTATVPTGPGCITVTPNGLVKDTGKLCITTCKAGRCDTTYVFLVPPTPTPDTLYVKPPCPTCPVTVCAVNDDVNTAGATSTSFCGTPTNYTATAPTGPGCITVTPNGLVKDTGKLCIATCNAGRCDTTYVFLVPPTPTPDTLYVKPPCPTCPVTVCAVNDDVNTAGATSTSFCGTPTNYTATAPTGPGCITLTPNGLVKDTGKLCIATCNAGRCDTTYVFLIPPTPTPDTIYVKPPCPTCPTTVCAVNDDVNTAGATSTSFCGTPTNYTATAPTGPGCITVTPNGLVKDTGKLCIATCNAGRCDTTYVFLVPPTPTPDTLYVKPPCPTCPVTVCAVNDDVNTTGATSTSFCGTPTNYTATAPTGPGCITVTPNGLVKDTGKLCIATCNAGRCDTTYVFLVPPIATPDTIYVKPPCPTCPVTVCAVNDDVSTAGATSTSFCGTPTNYTATAPTGPGCITLTPNGLVKDTGKLCISTCNAGRCDTTYVFLVPPTPTPDTIYVKPPCPTCPTTVCAVNDDVNTAGATSTSFCGTPTNYTATAPTGPGCITVTPNGLVKDTGKLCIATCNAGRCDTTYVFLVPPTPTPDTLYVKPPCPTCPVTVCAVNDDVNTAGATSTSFCGTPTNYTATAPTGPGCITVTPNGLVKDTGKLCIATCNAGRCDTTYVFLVPPIATPDTIYVKPPCPTCPVTVCAVNDDVSTAGATSTSFCGTPTNYTATAPTGPGCITLTPNGLVKDTGKLCIATCNAGRCDTTYVFLVPPTPTPDTLYVKPPCPTCPVTVCAVNDDVNTTGATSTSFCGTPTNYTATAPTGPGCITVTPNGLVKDTGKLCIATCNAGRCDTTYVFLVPPIATPDTIYVKPPCPTCPVTVCAVNDDVSTAGATSTSFCGTPTNYAATAPTGPGCITLTPNGLVKDTGKLCISTCNAGRCDTTYVFLVPPTPTPDSIYVKPPCPTCPTTVCAVNDDVNTAGATSTSFCGTPTNYTATAPTGPGCITVTPNGLVKDTGKLCIATCNAGRCDTTYVFLVPPTPTPDTLYVKPPCPTCPVTVCAVNDDVNTTGATSTSFCGTPTNYTATAPTGPGCITVTPNGLVKDTGKLCIATCNAGRCDTTYVFLVPPIATPDTLYVKPPCPTCPVTVCAVNDDVNTTGATSTSFCGTPTNYTATAPTGPGCITVTPNGLVKDTGKLCISTCNAGRCDTTYVFLVPPTPTPDTLYVKPPCPTCPVTVCAVNDDVNTTGATSTSICGTPANYSATTPTGPGCMTLTPDSTVKDTAKVCIVTCNIGRCDTTYVFLIPPTPTPDTIYVKPTCPTCPLTVCAVNDDVSIIGSTSTSICGTPANYTATVPTGPGCITLTPDGTVIVTSKVCIMTCNAGRCDTTYVIIAPPTYTGVTNPDINATFVNVSVNGSVRTNDIVPGLTTYGTAIPLAGNPDASVPVLDPNGSYTFISPTIGVYQFNVPVCLPGKTIGCPTELLTITVLDQNILPVANTDLATTIGTAPVVINSLANDKPGSAATFLVPSTVTIIQSPKHGTATVDPVTGKITYTANAGYIGEDTLRYQVCDNTVPQRCATAYQFISILPPGTNSTLASDDYTIGYQDIVQSGNVKLNDIDPEGHATSVTPKDTTIAGKGRLALSNDGSFVFTPFTGYFGPVSYTYEICDIGVPVACAKATLYVMVQPGIFKLNPDVNATFVNVSVTGNLKTNDITQPGTIYGAVAAFISNPSASVPVVSADGTYTFVTSVRGVYQFNVTVCPPGLTIGCPVQLLTITVLDDTTKTNPPVVNVDLAITKGTVPVTLNTLSNDKSGNVGIELNIASVAIVEPPKHGTATINATNGNITYIANAGFVGRDTLTYRVCDKSTPANCGTAYQIIDVLAINATNITTATDDYFNTVVNTAVSGNVLLNDIDPEGNNRLVVEQNVIVPGKGSFILNSDGSFKFTPEKEYLGPAQFPYTVCDDGIPKACASATLYITVAPPEDIILANYFSPNGDGYNDFWLLPQKFYDKYGDVKIMVYNRWGNLVWRSNGKYQNNWGGEDQMNGSPLPDGAYFYVIEFMNNFEKTLSGFVEIMRR